MQQMLPDLCRAGANRAALALLCALGLGLRTPALAAVVPSAAEAVLPPVVVVHGRRGPNSSLNGVYVRDHSWRVQGQRQGQGLEQGQGHEPGQGLEQGEGEGGMMVGPCYKRSGALGQQAIFLYFEGEWRMGPSPEEGSVWAYAHSESPSPLHIGTTWQVWDGQRVVRDPELRVSDTSVIPPVLFVSFTSEGPAAGAGAGSAAGEGTDPGASAGVPPPVRALQGMMLQQPGLWDGRPYYRHRAWEDLYLLCSVPEGRWRLGPLPVAVGGWAGAGAGVSASTGMATDTNAGKAPRLAPLLFSVSAAALPQEISEPWHVPVNETSHTTLGAGAVRLTVTSGLGVPMAGMGVGGGAGAVAGAEAWQRHPRHLLIEGITAAGGAANGVYRRALELVNERPVYNKTDALRPASLWFAGGGWRLGPGPGRSQVWAQSSSAATSPLQIGATWQLPDGQLEDSTRIADATQAIPESVLVAGDWYTQQPRLCDARPVYQRTQSPREGEGEEEGGRTEAPVFLFFRAHEGEWWLGPVIGGTECYARAQGSMLQVFPRVGELLWRQAATEAEELRAAQTPGAAWGELPAALDLEAAGAAKADSDAHAMPFSWLLAALALAVTALGYYGLSAQIQAGDEAAAAIGCGHGFLLPWLAGLGVKTKGKTKAKAKGKGKPPSLACVVCLEAPREILLLPCRHVCCCKACADRLERCPVCRTWKTAFTKVFL